MNEPFFSGTCTALVTPFLGDQVNFPMLQQLIERQIEASVEAIVVCGTTGEAATLTEEEKLNIYLYAKDFAGDRCKIIAGTGSNDTSQAIHLSICAELLGADALLVVSPYYNKATPEGIFRHYQSIAEHVGIPIIVYNVPSRTGLDIPVSVYKRLAEIPSIVGVKEASSDIKKLSRILEECPSDFHVWCGNDDMIVPAMSMGCKGVISVLSNLFPEKVQAMTRAALDGDFDTASSLQLELMPLIHALFCEVNPIPVKAAMKLLGFNCGGYRLPLTEPSEETMERLRLLLQK